MNENELVYNVVFETDAASLKRIRQQLTELEQQAKSFSPESVDPKGTKEAIDAQKKYQKATFETAETLGELKKQVLTYREELKQLKKSEEDTSERQAEIELSLKATSAEYRAQQKEILANKAAQDATGNTYNDLVTRNKQLSIAMKQVPLDDVTGQLERLKKEYAKNNDALKAFDKSIGNNQRNVGNYKDEMKAAIKESGLFGTKLQQLEEIQETLKKGFGAARAAVIDFGKGGLTAAKAFKVLKAAIIATGIGALVLALGSVVALIKRTDEGTRFLKVGAAQLGAALDQVVEVFIALGRSAVEAFENPKKAANDFMNFLASEFNTRLTAVKTLFAAQFDNFVQTFKILGLKIKNVLADVPILGDGIDVEGNTAKIEAASKQIEENLKTVGKAYVDAFVVGKDAVQGFIKDVREASAAAGELAGREEDLFKAETDLVLSRARLNKEIALAREEYEKAGQTEEERLANLDKAIALENKLLNEELAVAQERFDIIKEQNALAESQKEDLRAQAEAEAALLELKEKAANRRKELEGQRRGILERQEKEREAAQKSAQDAIDADTQARLDAFGKEVEAFEAKEKAKTELARKAEEQRKQFISAAIDLSKQFVSVVFGQSKAGAIAQAIINTYQAVTNSLANIPAPLNFAAAALSLVQGFKQVTAIKKTKLGGTSSSSSASSPRSTGVVSSARAARDISTGFSTRDVQSAIGSQQAVSASPQRIQPNVQLNVTNKLDREGLSIAVQEGRESLESKALSVISR